MADNSLSSGGTGDVIATDDLATINGGAVGSAVKVQRAKVGYGSDGDFRDVDTTHGLPVAPGQLAVSTASWTSATGVNTAVTIATVGMSLVSVAMANTSTMTAGVLTFEISPDGTNWFPIALARIDSYTVETTYTLNVVAARAWCSSVDAWANFRVRLSTAITGTGTASLFVTAQSNAIEPIVVVGQATAASLNATVTGTVSVNALPAGTNSIGLVGASNQTSPTQVTSAGLTVATTAYTSGDTAGTEMTFANAARTSGFGGVIASATLFDLSQKVNLIGVELWLFSAASTPSADNAANSWSDANIALLQGVVKFDAASWAVSALNSVNVQTNVGIAYKCAATSLFGVFVLRGVPAGNFFSAVGDLQVTLGFVRD
jgi:hypothetical protein